MCWAAPGVRSRHPVARAGCGAGRSARCGRQHNHPAACALLRVVLRRCGHLLLVLLCGGGGHSRQQSSRCPAASGTGSAPAAESVPAGHSRSPPLSHERRLRADLTCRRVLRGVAAQLRALLGRVVRSRHLVSLRCSHTCACWVPPGSVCHPLCISPDPPPLNDPLSLQSPLLLLPLSTQRCASLLLLAAVLIAESVAPGLSLQRISLFLFPRLPSPRR